MNTRNGPETHSQRPIAVNATSGFGRRGGLSFPGLPEIAPSMKTLLRRLSVILALAASVTWLALGRNTGWTKTSVTTMKTDPVTTLEYPVTEKRFVPGVDLLGLCLAGAGVLAGLSLLRLGIPVARP
jgi:hypothetical protein